MIDPVKVLTQRLTDAMTAAAPEAAGADPVVRPSDRADFQANGSMGRAKRLGTNPRELAQRVLDAVDLDGVATAEIAGPGFLNLTLYDTFLGRSAAEVVGNGAQDTGNQGVTPAESPQRVVIDYSAPNVAKEMHVGHLRSTVIGDALVRILEARGDTVIRQNHIGDWGTPFGMLIEHLIDLGEEGAIAELALGDLNEFYRQARVSFDGSEAFADRARARVVALQAGDSETLRLWQILVDLSAEYFQSVYDRLGVRLTVDDLAGESIYNDLLADVITDLDAAGLLVTSDGARCVFPDGFTNREGEPLPLIVTGWSRAQDVSGPPGRDYAIYIDAVYTDDTPLWGVVSCFSTGTHDWEERRCVVLPEKPLRSITVYALFRGHAGTAWFDDFALYQCGDVGIHLFENVPVTVPARALPEALSPSPGLPVTKRGLALDIGLSLIHI